MKIYIRHAMIVDKIHEMVSFKQSEWLEKYKNFSTQKRNKAKNGFEKDFYKLLINAFYGKAMESVHNRIRVEIFRKDDPKNVFKH